MHIHTSPSVSICSTHARTHRGEGSAHTASLVVRPHVLQRVPGTDGQGAAAQLCHRLPGMCCESLVLVDALLWTRLFVTVNTIHPIAPV